jgi:hypothetical protein
MAVPASGAFDLAVPITHVGSSQLGMMNVSGLPGSVTPGDIVTICDLPGVSSLNDGTPVLISFGIEVDSAAGTLKAAGILKPVHVVLNDPSITANAVLQFEGGPDFPAQNITTSAQTLIFDALREGIFDVLPPEKTNQPSLPTIQASCFDASYPANPPFSGPLDSRPVATYCSSALSQAGWTATSISNGSAGGAWAGLQTNDSLFYFAGHSWANCPGETNSDNTINEKAYTAAALEFQPSNGEDFLRGPMDDSCLQIPFDAAEYQFSSDLSHVKIAILQACQSTYDAGPYLAIGTQLHAAGVGTVLGFDGVVQFAGSYGNQGRSYPYREGGDQWAHFFWTFFGGGIRIDIAAAVATQYEERYSQGQSGGYDSFRLHRRPGSALYIKDVKP